MKKYVFCCFYTMFFSLFISEQLSAASDEDIKKGISLIIHLDSSIRITELRLEYYNKMVSIEGSPIKVNSKVSVGKVVHETVELVIQNVREIGYISLSENKNSGEKKGGGEITDLLYYYLIEPGDNIEMFCRKKNIHIRRYPRSSSIKYLYGNGPRRYGNADILDLTFKGKGADKFTCRYKLDYNSLLDTSSFTSIHPITGEICFENFNLRNRMESLRLLESYKRKMTPFAYSVMKADILGLYNTQWYQMAVMDCEGIFANNPSMSNQAKSSVNNYLLHSDTSFLPYEGKLLSMYYSSSIVKRERLRMMVNPSSQVDNYMFKYIRDNYSGELRDKIFYVLCKWVPYLKSSDAQFALKNSVILAKHVFWRDLIGEILNKNLLGRNAYNFSLTDTSGNKVHLSDFIGKVVLIDTWYTGCVWCASYHEHVLDSVYNRFASEANIVFLSISVDKDPLKWINSIKSGKYSSAGMINLYTNGRGEKDPFIDFYNINSYPSPILIDKKGEIITTSSVDLRELNKLLAAIEFAVK